MTDEQKEKLEQAADKMRESSYWQKRCEAAEKLIGLSPSDSITYPEFCRLREEWETIKQEKQLQNNNCTALLALLLSIILIILIIYTSNKGTVLILKE